MIVKVHNKQGEMICEISIDREIDYSLDVEKWVWDTAEHIAHEIEERSESIGEHFVEKMGNFGLWKKLKRRVAGPPRYFDIPITMFADYRCLTCGRDTIQPISTVGPLSAIGFSPEYEIAGYSCQNLDCPMHDIVAPKILIDRIDEKPQR